jgi:GNAT superfamily N-acetyltransferase
MHSSAALLPNAASTSLLRVPMISAHPPEPFHVAPLGLDDAPKLQRFLMRLDRDSLHRRFGHEVGDEAIRAHAVKALTDTVCASGAFADGDLRGVIELYACADRVVEVALVVEHGWRGRGLAWALLQQAMRSGCAGGSFNLVFARDNWPMRALAMKANARINLVFGEMCAEIDLTAHGRHS